MKKVRIDAENEDWLRATRKKKRKRKKKPFEGLTAEETVASLKDSLASVDCSPKS